jgi:hypothetical protein
MANAVTGSYAVVREGGTFNISNIASGQRGYGKLSVYDQWVSALGSLSASVPHMCVMGSVAVDSTTGEVYLVVETIGVSNTGANIYVDGGGNAAVDTFKLQGRPMIKGYGGVAA